MKMQKHTIDDRLLNADLCVPESPKEEKPYEDMKVASVHFDTLISCGEQDYDHRWGEISNGNFCFEHNEAAEYIFYIGGVDGPSNVDVIAELPHVIRNTARKAQEEGFKYLCVYA